MANYGSLEGVLASIPGLGGYNAQNQFNQQQQMGQLQQLGVLSQLAQRQQVLQRDAGLRNALGQLGQDATHEQVLRAAMPYAGADDLLKVITGSQDKRLAIQATQEQAKARLGQLAQQFVLSHEAKLRGLTNQEDRAREIARHNGQMEALQREAQKITGARLLYDTGLTPSGATAPQQAAPEPAGMFPANGPVGINVGGIQTSSPDNASALAMARSLQGGSGVLSQPQPAPAGPSGGVLSDLSTQYTPAAPNNLDARDLGARSRGPVMGTAMDAAPMGEFDRGGMPSYQSPAASPAQVAVPQMPPEVARMPKKYQDAWVLQQTRTSNAGAAVLSPQALRGVAEQVLAGDNTAAQGFARSAANKVAITNAVWDLANERKMDGDMVANKVAEFQGLKAGQRSVGTRGAQIAMAASEAKEMMDIVKETSDNFKRTNFVPWNWALKAYDTNTGSPEVREFGAAINSFVNVYARAINPTGVPTISDKEHARELVRSIDSPAQVDAVLKILGRELEIAKRAPRTVREDMRQEMLGGGASGGWSIRPR